MIPRLHDAARDRDLRDSALRVYLTLIYDLSPVEWRPVKHLALAKHLEISESTIERAIASLLQRGYLEAGTRTPGSPQHYRLVYSRKVA
jgi:predicted transcriptional regulator